MNTDSGSPPGDGAISTGASLQRIRERRPLVHQITNFVVMNETANATLAIGALPVMAHAPEEVAEMASAAGALVLNIGTLTLEWVASMILAGHAANRAGVPVVLDPVGAGATSLRTRSAERILDELDVAIVRGNAAEIASLAGQSADIRGVESMGTGQEGGELARTAARKLRCVVAVTGAVDAVSDGTSTLSIANGHPMLATVTGTGCIASALVGCFAAVNEGAALRATAEALVALGVAGENAAARSSGPGSFHVALYDALYALSPDTIDARARVTQR
ncbi:MAG TPA: hydroxyethylthiazole kinase [Candidatus Dormibacteraeota bacterium]